MNLHLSGQQAVIIGGARGIGLAIARAFLAEECRVVIADRDPAALESLPGDTCSTHLVDATNRQAMEQLAARCPETDHVVYAAGTGSGKFGFPFWNLHPDDWNRVIQVNLIGAVQTAHAFAPLLVARESGTLLFLTSVAGQMGSQTDPPYSAAKAALINFMQVAAKDLAPHHVRVNALAPGMVQTVLNRSVWAAGQALLPEAERQDYETWAEQKIRRVSPLGRWQGVEEFGAMAVFLASQWACSITGQTLNIDGGQVMHS